MELQAALHQCPARPSCPPARRAACRQRSRQHRRTAAAPATQPEAAKPPADPFAEKEVYKDGWFNQLMIRYFASKMSQNLGNVPYERSWDGFVALSKELMKGRSSKEQRQAVAGVLDSLMPQDVQGSFKNLFPPNRFSAETNARLTTLGFAWLVGPMELQTSEIEHEGKVQQWRNKVLIKKCRYLESSGCVGMCTNMCQQPTQNFFENALGLPLTMTPNFEDLSCEMSFGVKPPPLEEDPVFTQPCFVHQCKLGNRDPKAPCPKTETSRQQHTAS